MPVNHEPGPAAEPKETGAGGAQIAQEEPPAGAEAENTLGDDGADDVAMSAGERDARKRVVDEANKTAEDLRRTRMRAKVADPSGRG